VAEPEPEPVVADPAMPEPVVDEPVAVVPAPEVAESPPINSQPANASQEDTFPSGWYTDYADSSVLRYWDGAEWTEHVHPAATAD
jgi:hypothetical protein